MDWKIFKVFTKDYGELDENSHLARHLQEDEKVEMIQSNKFHVRVNFTEPELVSRSSLDTILVSVIPGIMDDEPRYEFKNAGLKATDTSEALRNQNQLTVTIMNFKLDPL